MTDPYLRRPHTESNGGATLSYMIAATAACILLAIAVIVITEIN